MYTIYKLSDPDTKELMYVGITSKTATERLARHLSEAYTRKRLFSSKGPWLAQLFDRGLIPLLEIIEETKDKSREEFWIKFLKPTLNVVFGNDKALYSHIANGESLPVYQYGLDGTYLRSWTSATVVELELGIDNTNISACMSNKRRQAGGFIWKPYRVQAINAYTRARGEKPIARYHGGVLVKVYPSARAAEVDGFTYKGISKVLTGQAKSHNYNTFKYAKVEDIVRSSEKSEMLQ